MSSNEGRGKFVWYDLMTTDPDAAIDFYGKVIGWGTQPFEGSPTPYNMWTVDQTPIGGVMDLPEEARQSGAPPHWLTYVATPDVDQTAARTQELGGQVFVPPTDIPSVGRFTVLADPQGAAFAAFTPTDAPAGDERPPKTGEFSWHELVTTDRENAFDFYHDLFGWDRMEAMDMGPAGVYQIYGRQGVPLGGMFNKTEDMGPVPPNWTVYAHVDDVHETVEKVKANGGQVINGPMEVPGGDWIAQCLDPQGAMFAVHGKK